MNAMLVVIVGIIILIAGYVFYGGWLAKQWGVDDTKVTPVPSAQGPWREHSPYRPPAHGRG